MNDYLIYVSFFTESNNIIDVQYYNCLYPQASYIQENIDNVVEKYEQLYNYMEKITWKITDSDGFETLEPHKLPDITIEDCISLANNLNKDDYLFSLGLI